MKAADLVDELTMVVGALDALGDCSINGVEVKPLVMGLMTTVNHLREEIEWTKNRPAFERLTRLTLHLHKEIAKGRGEEVAADEIRDAMDVFAHGMMPWQSEIINQLSAALKDDPGVDITMQEKYERKEEALAVYASMPIG